MRRPEREPEPGTTEAAYAEAHAAWSANEDERAFRTIAAHLERVPDFLDGHLLATDAARRASLLDESEKHALVALRLTDGESAPAWASLAFVHAARGRVDEAVKAYERSYALEKTDWVIANIGELWTERVAGATDPRVRERYAERAFAAFARGRERFPGETHGYWNEACVLSMLGRDLPRIARMVGHVLSVKWARASWDAEDQRWVVDNETMDRLRRDAQLAWFWAHWRQPVVPVPPGVNAVEGLFFAPEARDLSDGSSEPSGASQASRRVAFGARASEREQAALLDVIGPDEPITSRVISEVEDHRARLRAELPNGEGVAPSMFVDARMTRWGLRSASATTPPREGLLDALRLANEAVRAATRENLRRESDASASFEAFVAALPPWAEAAAEHDQRTHLEMFGDDALARIRKALRVRDTELLEVRMPAEGELFFTRVPPDDRVEDYFTPQELTAYRALEAMLRAASPRLIHVRFDSECWSPWVVSPELFLAVLPSGHLAGVWTYCVST